MKIKERIEKLKSFGRRLTYELMRLPWGHVIVIIICLLISATVFYVLQLNSFKTVDTNSTLSNLLTVNAVFSAILITYLFSRITWSKERKLEIYKEAVMLSQKITEYRRILNKLTSYYNVWRNDNATKSLIDFGKFKNIDFYDYRIAMTTDYEPKNYKLIREFFNHTDFSEGQSTLYLAMVSLVRNRNNPDYEYHPELYKDFELDGLYNFKAVKKWLECGIFGTLSYWLDNTNYINYLSLGADNRNYILAAASRINKKYEGHQLNNELLKELADDFDSHYLKELYVKLKHLKKGIRDLNLLIITLITISMIFGVLGPFTLLLIQTTATWFSIAVSVLASINAGLIGYFIIRFPRLISKELKWV